MGLLIMKKTYIQPEVLTMKLQHMQMLCESLTSVQDGNGNTGIGYGGEGTGPARVKDTNVWDEEW